MEVCSNELCHSTPRGKMHLLWEKLMLKLISGSHWIYALKDQLRNISNVYFTFNWFQAFRVVASVEQMLLCYYQVNLLMWLLPTNIGMKSIHTSAEWFWRYWRQLFVSNFWFEKFADVTLVYENWNEVKAHIQFQWNKIFQIKMKVHERQEHWKLFFVWQLGWLWLKVRVKHHAYFILGWE